MLEKPYTFSLVFNTIIAKNSVYIGSCLYSTNLFSKYIHLATHELIYKVTFVIELHLFPFQWIWYFSIIFVHFLLFCAVFLKSKNTKYIQKLKINPTSHKEGCMYLNGLLYYQQYSKQVKTLKFF